MKSLSKNITCTSDIHPHKGYLNFRTKLCQKVSSLLTDSSDAELTLWNNLYDVLSDNIENELGNTYENNLLHI